MSHDIPRRTSNALHIPNLYMNDPEFEGSVLYELQAILDGHSKAVTDFGLPPLSKRLLKELKNKEMMEEKSYNREELVEEVVTLTFLWRTIINSLRSHGKTVLAVASSGIASLLLPSSRTAHSKFKLPLELTDESICGIKKNTH
nr:DNA helicase [Tanacetum cinerariifolium]